MFTTDGVAARAASAKVRLRLASRPTAVAGADCCNSTTLPTRCVKRGSKSGRRVATTKSAARQSVQACANSSQNLCTTDRLRFLRGLIIGPRVFAPSLPPGRTQWRLHGKRTKVRFQPTGARLGAHEARL